MYDSLQKTHAAFLARPCDKLELEESIGLYSTWKVGSNSILNTVLTWKLEGTVDGVSLDENNIVIIFNLKLRNCTG